MPMPRRRAAPTAHQPDSPAGQDRDFVTALARGLEVLGCFRRGESLLGNQEIAARCGLPRSTVSRLTHTLTQLGYLHYVPELGRYRLGTAVLALGSAMLGGLDIRRVARPCCSSSPPRRTAWWRSARGTGWGWSIWNWRGATRRSR
ncbi:helix-turn-helix domain-containing protein [Teichococcus aestuarii]|uniref:helix-turn-helix domain-containing protein n=1 Tax=Teichococcus aestuarii TaxID=568898 RepID=UPI00361F1BD5